MGGIQLESENNLAIVERPTRPELRRMAKVAKFLVPAGSIALVLCVGAVASAGPSAIPLDKQLLPVPKSLPMCKLLSRGYWTKPLPAPCF